MTKRILPRRSHLTVLAMLLGFATLAAASADDRTAATPPPASGAAEGETASSAERRSAAIALFNEGVDALRAEDLVTANARFIAAIKADPEFPEPYRALAATASEAEDWAAAANWAEGLLRFEPANLEAMRTVYFGRLMVGDVEGARTAALRLAAADPASLPEILDHAKTFFANNDFAMARVLLEVFTGVGSSQADPYFSLGVCCNALGDADAARTAFSRFVELAPADHPDVAAAKEMLEFLK